MILLSALSWHIFLIVIAVKFIMDTAANTSISMKSPAFEHGELIPDKFTCRGLDINPELVIENIPEDTKSLALIVHDSDTPGADFDHWLIWNIPFRKKIEENSAPGVQGRNGFGESRYSGPCPPAGIHHYHFRIYALDTVLNLEAGADKKALNKAMGGHILAWAELMGIYKNSL
jgi:Raf kinase inhibitor-like YbhB/YbcL family protein